jgi:hypothetical protein
MVVTLDARRRLAQESGSIERQSLNGESVFSASANGLKDGLFGRVHHLDDEDPDEIAALRARYQAANQPRDPTEDFLVNELFIGHVQGRRYQRALNNELRRQQRVNRQRWEEEREKTAGALRDQLMAPDAVDLQPILMELRGFSHGLEALAQQWLRLGEALRKRGFLSPQEWATGLRLLGVLATTEAIAQHQDSFLFSLWSAGCNPAAPAGMITTLLQPANRPAGLEDASRAELLPDAAACRNQLTQWVDEALAELAARADQVAREVDGPELARVLNPAAIVMDPERAKRFDRARSNYQSTFYRALNALEAHRKAAAAANQKPPRLGADPGPDIKPPAPDGGIAAAPSGAPAVVTEVVCEQPDSASDETPGADSQNGTGIAPERAATDRPGACRSYDKQVAGRTVGAVVTVPVRPSTANHSTHRPQDE